MIAPTAANAAGKRTVRGGGPESEAYTVKAQSAAGSLENLRRINRGTMPFGVVCSGRVYQGREGQLKIDDRTTRMCLPSPT